MQARRWPLVLPTASLVLTAATACGFGDDQGTNQVTVSQAEYGTEWPFSVDEGVVECTGGDVVTFTADGVTYLLDGPAMRQDLGAQIGPVWLDDPNLDGHKMNLGSLISRGLDLCD